MALRVVVVGLGPRGQDWIREIQASPTCELGGCADADQNVLQSVSKHLRIPKHQCFVDLSEALDKSGCQAVIVATPADRHFQISETVLTRGLGLMVEKPFTLRLGEARKLVSLAEANGAPLLVAQNYRYMRAFRTARRVIADGMLGQVGIVVCQYYRVPHEMARSLAQLTHSVLWGMGVHHLDMLRYVLGQKVTGLLAESFTLPWGQLPPGASIRLMLSFEGETRGFYSATYESSGHEFFEQGQEFYCRFVGERATLHVFQRWLILFETGRLPRFLRRGPRKVTEEQILLHQLERAVLFGEVPEVSGRDNLQTMAVIEACQRSATEQKWINPQELLDD